MTGFDLELGARNVRLLDYDWESLPSDEHGRYIVELFDLILVDDHRAAKALSRGLEGIDFAIERERPIAKPYAERLITAGATLKRSAADSPLAFWLVSSMDAVLEIAQAWAVGKNVPSARHDDLRKWLRTCRLTCECHTIGAEIQRQHTAARPPVLN